MQISRRQLLRVPRRPARALDGFWLHVHREAMACRFQVTTSASCPWAAQAAADALEEVARVDEWLSIFRESSEAARLNVLAPDETFVASPEMLALLRRCQELHACTEGCFDPTATALARCWGFLARQGRVPSAEELGAALGTVGMSRVILDAEEGSVRYSTAGTMIGFGAIGKGLALDRAAARLACHAVGHALLSAAGSSVVALGDGDDGHGWQVGLRDPRDAQRRIGLLRLRSAALGVSACSEQWFDAQGRRWGHILDPRSGWPVAGRLQVAVVAPEAALADALATAFFVGGAELASRACARLDDVLAIFQEEAQPEAPILIGDNPHATLEAWYG
jgi:thiamine biosynthesis lipoprotein